MNSVKFSGLEKWGYGVLFFGFSGESDCVVKFTESRGVCLFSQWWGCV